MRGDLPRSIVRKPQAAQEPKPQNGKASLACLRRARINSRGLIAAHTVLRQGLENSRLADWLRSGTRSVVVRLRSRTNDSQLLHTEVQSCPIQSQSCCGTPRPGENP